MNDFIYPYIGDEASLPYYVIGVGGSDYQYHVDRPEGYPYHQFIYCINGQGLLKFNGGEYIIDKNKGFYLPANVPHEYYCTDEKWETHWITFDGYLVERILATLGFKKEMVFNVAEINSIDSILKKILYVLKSNSFYSNYECSGLFYMFLLELKRTIETKDNFFDSHKQKQLKPVIDYIDNNFSRDITLEELSEVINVSPQYLCRLFKECLDVRPFSYIARRRIQEAKQLLLSSKGSVNTISTAVGYNDCSYFCSVFKKHEMISPAEFRTLHQK